MDTSPENSYRMNLITFMSNALYDRTITIHEQSSIIIHRRDPDGREWEYEFSLWNGAYRHKIIKFEKGKAQYVIDANQGVWSPWQNPYNFQKNNET